MQSETGGTRSIIAYVAPLACYMIPTMFEASNLFGLSYESACTLKGVLAIGAFWVFHRHYPAYSTAGFRLAVIAGFLGMIVWVGLDRLQASLPALQRVVQMIQGSRVGYDPFANGGPSALQVAFVIVRLVELTIIVPLIEEIFWRGFLSRFLIAEDFEKVEQGTYTLFSFFIGAVMFASAHTEVISAIVWCSIINALYVKTRNVWACVMMHAVTNGLLGVYILMTKEWHLW